MGMGDQQRAPLAGRGQRELVAVDQADAGLDRVDAEPAVGQVEERQPRHDPDSTRGSPSRWRTLRSRT